MEHDDVAVLTLGELRQLLRQGLVDVVVCHAVDRLSRNQNHIGVLFDEVQQAGARLEFVTEKFEDTAVGRFSPPRPCRRA